MANDTKQPTASGLTRANGSMSLEEIPDGDHMAYLPALDIGETKISVHVATWKRYDGPAMNEVGSEKVVSFNHGTCKGQYATDRELEGARFFPSNTED